MSITERLADHAIGLKFDSIPTEVVEKTKHHLLDLLGIMVRAKFDAESSEPVTAAVRELGGAAGSCTAVGNSETFTPAHAALINGIYAHSLDFDDTHRRASLHPGTTVIPTALALAESTNADGKTLTTAIVAGYDITCKVSIAAKPKIHYDRGFHPTATTGVFGSTAAGSVILKLDRETLQNAFGINGSQVAGSMQFLENGAWNKRLHVGFAAHNAILSLVMAQKGAVGASHPIEGFAGFFHAYSDGANPELAIQDLGHVFEVSNTALKPYPSCRFSHSAIDLIIEIVEEEDIRGEDIEEMTVGLPAKGMDLVGIPADRKRRPQSVVDGQFSMHFTGAIAAAHRRMTWADYGKLSDPEIVRIMDRMHAIEDPEAEAVYPDSLAGSVTIKAKGKDIRRFCEISKGEPEKPLSWEAVVSKFNDLAAIGLDQNRREQIIGCVANIEELSNVKDLMALLRP